MLKEFKRAFINETSILIINDDTLVNNPSYGDYYKECTVIYLSKNLVTGINVIEVSYNKSINVKELTERLSSIDDYFELTKEQLKNKLDSISEKVGFKVETYLF